MENQLKAITITLLILLILALGVYGFTRNVQFIGFLIGGLLLFIISAGLYNAIYSHLNDKTKNKQS